MVFSSDRQRKGFFGSRGRSRSNVNPRITRMKKLPKNVSDFISMEISSQRRKGKSQRQSIRIAFEVARKKFPRQKSQLTLIKKMNPNGTKDQRRRFLNLLVLLVGTAVALRILRTART